MGAWAAAQLGPGARELENGWGEPRNRARLPRIMLPTGVIVSSDTRVVMIPKSSGPVETRRRFSMDHASETTHSSPENVGQQLGGAGASSSVAKGARPCDICRKRKSKCVKEPGQTKCVLCAFHGRECTYVSDAPRRRKRRALSGAGPEVDRSSGQPDMEDA
jgi:hypothetical protein